jgi:hypothetical protein
LIVLIANGHLPQIALATLGTTLPNHEVILGKPPVLRAGRATGHDA